MPICTNPDLQIVWRVICASTDTIAFFSDPDCGAKNGDIDLFHFVLHAMNSQVSNRLCRGSDSFSGAGAKRIVKRCFLLLFNELYFTEISVEILIVYIRHRTFNSKLYGVSNLPSLHLFIKDRSDMATRPMV